MRHFLLSLLMLPLVLNLWSCGEKYDDRPRNTRAEGFVYLDEEGRLAIDGEEWLPLMVNYKVDWRREGTEVWISPAHYYETPNEWDDDSLGRWEPVESHMRLMEELGANAVRICMDVVNRDGKGYFYGSADNPIYLVADSSDIFEAVDRLTAATSMRVMLLLKAPLDEELRTFATGLLRHEAKNKSIWAYDMMNEPLYFDPAEKRGKDEAYAIVKGWQEMMEKNAPHQLFTIGFAEPIEVFEWDPSLLPVDFVEVHTYHPLRVASEMYWYGHYCGKPWMVGETALPADNDSIPYKYQCDFMRESFRCAMDNGAIGYGWWEFQDCLGGVNFEAQHTGLLNHEGQIEVAPNGVALGRTLKCSGLKPTALMLGELKVERHCATVPVNYHNMLGYENIVLRGNVVEKGSGKPVEGAVIRGWNEDWSVGKNTFSDAEGNFALYSNDYCVHFEISAPGMSHLKFDRENIKYNPKLKKDELPERGREYQQIDYRPFLMEEGAVLRFKPELFGHHKTGADMGTLYLKRLKK